MKFLKNTFQFNRRKSVIGAAFALFSVCLCGAFGAWAAGGIFAAAFLTAGCIKVNIAQPRWRYLLFTLWALGVSALVLTFPAATAGAAGQVTAGAYKILLNFICIWIVWGAVYVITASGKVAVILGSFLLLALAAANGFVYQFRGKELGCMDILSMKTALQVAGQYTPQFSFEMVRSFLSAFLLLFAGFSLPPLPRLPKWRARGISLVGTALFIWILSAAAGDIPIKTWDNEGTRLNGYYLNFYLGIRDASVQKPEDYNAAHIEKQAQQYIVENNIRQDSADLPNILVIMEESFADFRVLGDLQTNEPVTPFLDSLSENTVRGYALTSVFGGNTANAEFEFLTGHSMAFLPENSVPYQQYIRGETRTLAWLMRANGYKTVSTHPYYANGWSRNRIYPYFGFEESTFIEEYSTAYPVRNYVSDRDMFTYLLDVLKEKKEEKPLFLFGITMQNHGGYDYSGENFEETVKLVGTDRAYPMAEQYLSLLHETDSAIEYLLTALAQQEEKTMVLIFGDHFPKVESAFYEALSGGSLDTLDKQMLSYTVPFLLWANYDIAETTVPCTSLNFLSCHLLETAGLPLSPYHRFLSQTEAVIPAMNALGYYARSQGRFASYDEATGDEAVQLGQYEALVYNHLFDTKHQSKIFFGN